ncbi:hypothetical protein [Streptomyces sp. NPDC001404]|uniref:hypothetical protein n=1 Tax=Streptomyces sp. NPDC001404 TaxID=3364571 RepID=UPI0036959AD7
MATTVVYTQRGRELIANAVNGTTFTPKYIGWGINSTNPTAASTDVAPFQEASEARVTGTTSVVTTTTTNDTYQVVGTITSASTQTINESILANSATKPGSTTLSAAITTTGATSMTVTSAAAFPSSGTYYIQIDSEVIAVTAGQGTTTWTITRGANGSTAATHSNGATVTLGNPPGTTGNNGDLFMHASYTGLALNNGDSLSATFQLKFS